MMSEDDHQEKVFDWIQNNLIQYPELEVMYANMNGVRRSRRYTAKLKNRGLKTGVPDMFLPVARYGFHGLYIELKRPATKDHNKGYLSKRQKWYIEKLINEGYAVKVCYGWKSTVSVLKFYLETIK